MFSKRILSIGILAVAALGLGACADQYAYGRAPGYGNAGVYADYNQYWGDPYGYQYVPVGFVGQGFGWQGNYYYPGQGAFVYDRRGVRRSWNRNQQAFWQPRIVSQRPVIGNRIGGSIARQGIPQGQIRQQQRVNRQQVQVNRQQMQVDRQRARVERQRGQVERQQGQVQRQQGRVQRQQGMNQPQNRGGWQGQRRDRRN